MSNWIPTETPYRVTEYLRDDTPGLMGWRSRVIGTYATEAEARVAFDVPPSPRMSSRQLDVAMNPTTWLHRGRWHAIAELKRPKAPKGSNERKPFKVYERAAAPAQLDEPAPTFRPFVAKFNGRCGCEHSTRRCPVGGIRAGELAAFVPGDRSNAGSPLSAACIAELFGVTLAPLAGVEGR